MISTVIGLGNIGDKYSGTRHNLGFEVINAISYKWRVRPKPGKGNYYFAHHKYAGRIITLVWPTAYMNNSGMAAEQVMEVLSLTPEEILVVYDDLNLPLGKIRIRQGGSSGGHNGIGSVIEHTGTENIPRIRLGIGPLPENADQVNFVLGKFSEDEQKFADKMIGQAADAVLYSLKHGLEDAMTKYNNPAPEE